MIAIELKNIAVLDVYNIRNELISYGYKSTEDFMIRSVYPIVPKSLSNYPTYRMSIYSSKMLQDKKVKELLVEHLI